MGREESGETRREDADKSTAFGKASTWHPGLNKSGREISRVTLEYHWETQAIQGVNLLFVQDSLLRPAHPSLSSPSRPLCAPDIWCDRVVEYPERPVLLRWSVPTSCPTMCSVDRV